jgi:hypothetical protein
LNEQDKIDPSKRWRVLHPFDELSGTRTKAAKIEQKQAAGPKPSVKKYRPCVVA